MKKYECPCCGFYTFDEKPNGSYDICPVCFWEEEFHYKILMVSEESRWIYLTAERWDCEEPDAFVALVKRIAEDLKGTIVDKGMTTYQIDNDLCRLTYQWDTCFGITVVYPEDVSSSAALDFLNKYL